MATQRPSTVRLRTRLLSDAIDIVEAEYAAPISLDDLAHRVAASRRQLQRVFAEIGGTTFREHLTRVRMQHAAEMLASGELPVREVARRVGYRQPAQFAKAFRRQQGVPPSVFALRHGRGQGPPGDGREAPGPASGTERSHRAA
jgi:transcriptional regulator GlxA family with amidase domain